MQVIVDVTENPSTLILEAVERLTHSTLTYKPAMEMDSIFGNRNAILITASTPNGDLIGSLTCEEITPRVPLTDLAIQEAIHAEAMGSFVLWDNWVVTDTCRGNGWGRAMLVAAQEYGWFEGGALHVAALPPGARGMNARRGLFAVGFRPMMDSVPGFWRRHSASEGVPCLDATGPLCRCPAALMKWRDMRVRG